MSLIAIFVVCLFLFGLVSGRLKQTVLSAPTVFTGVGMLVLLMQPELRERQGGLDVFLLVAEAGLVLLLFADASRCDLRLLKRMGNLPFRLLSSGLLLTLLLGALCAKAIFPHISIWEAGILAAILAPTDAGLGQAIVSSPRVPMKIRQALNVEAGLNDGLAVPFLLFFIALAEESERQQGQLTRFIVEQLGCGALVGVGIGLIGGWLLGWSRRQQWMVESWQQLSLVALPVLCMLVSHAVGASMFIAAFVAGLAVQARFKEASRHSIEFTEEWGQVLNLSVFFLFGLLVAREWGHFEVHHFMYAVLSLTVVRMLPVALSLMGARLSRATVLFMGWFGPRGLASIVLGLVYLEETNLSGEPAIYLTVMTTVFLSIFAHGMSTPPGIVRYSEKIASLPPGAPELDDESSTQPGFSPKQIRREQ